MPTTRSKKNPANWAWLTKNKENYGSNCELVGTVLFTFLIFFGLCICRYL